MADNVNVRRGDKKALIDISFSVPRREITALLGPSGCGKTTLMRAIVGVQAHVEGELNVLGYPAGAPQLRHEIGYVTQAASVYTDLTAQENLNFFAGMTGASHRDVHNALAAVDLLDRKNQIVRSMSGGQRSRVSLAAALLARPKLLVLDEPTVGLDPLLRQSLWALFTDLAADGCTLLVSSHVLDEADHASHLLLMRDGKLLTESSPSELKQQTGCDSIEDAFLEVIK